MEFEFRPDGRLRYANDSQYKNDVMIRKECAWCGVGALEARCGVLMPPTPPPPPHTGRVHKSIIEELKRIVRESEIMKADDAKWPEPDRVGRQELEVVLDNEHISFTCSKIGSLTSINESEDPESLRGFYFLTQDLKCLVFSLISLHFKIKPIPA